MRRTSITYLSIVALTVALLNVNTATAKKPPDSGGGGGEPSAAALNPAIAFISTQTSGRNAGRRDVVVASADLASEIVLTKNLQTKQKGYFVYDLGSPAWSPDGTHVAFWAQDWSNPEAVRTQLFVAKADGSLLTLVRDFASRPHVQRPGFVCDGLNWSPTGLELVYDGYSAVVAIEVATGDLRLLLDGFYTGDPIEHPALSPDLDPSPGYQGKLATRGLDGSVNADGTPQWDIYTASLSTDEDGYLLPVDPATIVNVTNGVGTNEFHPSWSPDGRYLACFHGDGVNAGLYIINVATDQILPLWPDYRTVVCAEDRATWTSDALNLVYRTGLSGIPGSDLTIIRSDGTSGPANYTNSSSLSERAPAWNPNWDPLGSGAP